MFSIYAHPCDGNRDRADLVGDSSRRVPPGGLADLEVALGARVRDEAGAAPAGNWSQDEDGADTCQVEFEFAS